MFKNFKEFLLRTLFRDQDYVVGYDGDTEKEIRVTGANFRESLRGSPGANAQIQFSANMENWHFPAMEGDIYVRFRTGLGEWSACRFVGKDGEDGIPGIIAYYSADAQNWHSLYQEGDKYIMFKLTDNTYTEPIRIVGNDGENIELQATNEYIQWRVVGDDNWIDLISLSELGGGGSGDGTKWLSGNGTPSSSLGNVGDWYVNIDTQGVFEKTGSSVWTFRLNMKGDKGDAGNEGKDGKDGTDGKDGADGSRILQGTTTPANSTGVVGDWYINIVLFDIYEKTGDITWTLRGNIKGEKGDNGDKGDKGDKGDAGGLAAGDPFDFLITNWNGDLEWLAGVFRADGSSNEIMIENYAKKIVIDYIASNDLNLSIRTNSDLFVDLQEITIVIFNNRVNDLIVNIDDVSGIIEWKDPELAAAITIDAKTAKEISLLPYMLASGLMVRGIVG